MAPKKVRAVGIKLMKSQQLFGGDIRGVLEVAKICDRMGVDEIHVSDHVLMTGEGHRGRAGFPYPPRLGWLVRTARDARRDRLRHGAGATLQPCAHRATASRHPSGEAACDPRCAVGGRVDIGLGVGWQSQEFAAAGSAVRASSDRLVEEVEGCRAFGERPRRTMGDRPSLSMRRTHCRIPCRVPTCPFLLDCRRDHERSPRSRDSGSAIARPITSDPTW